jgi:hypothetical protein
MVAVSRAGWTTRHCPPSWRDRRSHRSGDPIQRSAHGREPPSDETTRIPARASRCSAGQWMPASATLLSVWSGLGGSRTPCPVPGVSQRSSPPGGMPVMQRAWYLRQGPRDRPHVPYRREDAQVSTRAAAAGSRPMRYESHGARRRSGSCSLAPHHGLPAARRAAGAAALAAPGRYGVCGCAR